MASGDEGRHAHESRYGQSFFSPEAAGEGERIDFGAPAYDDIAMARLRALGAGPGWHCPDVGAGTGTVSRRLLEEAGVASVLAVDRDVRFLGERSVPGLEVHEADITGADFAPGRFQLAPGRFQLVHARFVLMHLPEHERLITALAERVGVEARRGLIGGRWASGPDQGGASPRSAVVSRSSRRSLSRSRPFTARAVRWLAARRVRWRWRKDQ